MRRTLPLLGGLSLLALALPALAAGWGAYASAFPTNPCADGWAGCVVGDVAVDPGFAKDSGGRPLVSGMRVGWFDLAPTASFSPFVGLSAYRQASAGAASVLADAAPPPTAPPVAVDPGMAVPPPVVPTAAPTAMTTPPAVATGTGRPPETTARTTATTTYTPPVASYTPPATTYTPPTTSAPTVATAPTIITPTVSTAPVAAPSAGTATDPTATASTARTSAGTQSPPTTDVIKAVEGCDDDVALQPLALMGQLSSSTAKCLEAKVSSDLPQTSRDKYSRVLIANAEAKGDKVEWERLVRRHLEDIDRSDPDLCYKYALQLSRGGVSRSSGVIRWTEYALENKQRWQGQTYKNRVFALYKLRAEAGARLWEAAEKEFTTGAHTDENEAKATKLRGQAKDFAKEWLDYARTSSQDTQTAMSLCVSAAGNRQYCDGG